MAWRSFVALGDSFTEGLDDPYPDGSGYRGWADLVAGALPDILYANLAIRGRLLPRIVDEQVPVALAMKPELVSLAGGGNDALRRNFDAAALVQRFGRAVSELRAAGADVLLFRFADLSDRLPARRVVRPRLEALNRAVVEIAERHGARLVDLWSDEEFRNPLLWSVDRLHLSDAGHRRVAAHVLAALKVDCDPGWLTAPAAVRTGWVRTAAGDARWVAGHLAPWMRRRITGRSSGDNRVPKRPGLTRVR
jgi:lysophospholipase L1-like esterase